MDIKQPEIVFHADEVFDAEVSGENPEEALESERKSELGDANAENEAEKIVLSVEDYNVTFDREIMEHVTFTLHAGDKVAIVGPNGTGKTTLLRDVIKGENPAIRLGENVKMAYLSQMHGEVFDEKATVLKNFENAGFDTDDQVTAYLKTYGFEEELIYSSVCDLSGGEKNLLQLAKISRTGAGLLLLDEPTSHLDTYSQLALEQAVEKYNGTVLMVSHDFYTVANCMDYVLLTEDKGLRKVSMRKFRKMIYADHFDKDYLEYEQKKKELENRIAFALQAGKYEDAKKISQELEKLLRKYNG